MNREDIIRMAREAGFYVDEKARQNQPNCISHTYHMIDNQLERFATLVAAASEEQWKQAVIAELVSCHIYNAAHENDPRKALHDAISWNVEVALDPQVSSDAQALIDRGAAAERNSWPAEMEAMERQVNILTDALAQAKAEEIEACAKVCESMRPSEREFDQRFYTACTLNANAIRARSK